MARTAASAETPSTTLAVAAPAAVKGRLRTPRSTQVLSSTCTRSLGPLNYDASAFEVGHVSPTSRSQGDPLGSSLGIPGARTSLPYIVPGEKYVIGNQVGDWGEGGGWGVGLGFVNRHHNSAIVVLPQPLRSMRG